MKHLSTLALAIGISLAAGFSTNGQSVATESFPYAPGTGVITAEGTGGSGWGFGWNSKGNLDQVMSGSLSYTDGLGNTLATSGGSLVSSTTTSTTAQPERALTGTIGALGAANTYAAGTLWVSYLWQGLNTTGSGSGLYRQSIMMFITGATATSGSGTERLDVGMPNISAATVGIVNPNLSLWTSGSPGVNAYTSTAPLQSGVAANNGATTFVLMRFNVDTTTNTDSVSIWLNPTLNGATPGAAADLTYSGQDLSGINGLRIQSGSLNATYGSVGGQQWVDEINIGDTVGSVEPLAVPEPASFALAGLGGLAGLLALRRRQS
jgi:hypothetical protein